MLAPRSPWSLALLAALLPAGAAACEVVAGIRDIELATDAGNDDAGVGGGDGDAQVDADAPDGAVCHRGGAAASVVCDCSERIDTDRDGYFTCDVDPKKVDCDDSDAKVHPGAAEICNGKDDDCNGSTDDVPAQLHGSLSAPADAHWVAAGNAVLTASGATLTNDAVGQTGAVWWKTPYTFDAFDMNATFTIEAKPDGADGCAFGWVPGVTVPGIGAGNGYGLGGLGGYGVAIDTYQNAGEPPVPFLVVLGANASPYTIPNVRDGRPHTMRVQLVAGAVNVWIDTIQYVKHLAIPNYAPFTGYWGFAAGGGNAFEAHYVSDLMMSFPNGQGCRP